MLGAQQPGHSLSSSGEESRKQEITKAHRYVRGEAGAGATATAPDASTTQHQKTREHGQHHGKMRTTIYGRQDDSPQRQPGPGSPTLCYMTFCDNRRLCDVIKLRGLRGEDYP